MSRNDNPTPRTRVLDLRRVKATEQLKVIILSPWVMGYDTHWLGDHTEPCTKRHGACTLCDEKKPHKWIGFIHCIEPGGKTSFFLELTDHAWADMKKQASPLVILRGLQFVFSRLRATMKSPVTCSLISNEPYAEHRLPAAKEVEPSLRVAWKRFF
jgi:hypothetical protein